MSITAAREYLKKYGAAARILELEQSSATVALAAQALGCEPARIAKTMSFRVAGSPILVVTAGNCRIDNPKFKQQFGKKARMLSPEEVLSLVGHAVGGVCPFGVLPGVKTYLDVSLKAYTTVFPACGSGNSAIEVTPEELEQFSRSLGWVDVCRLPADPA